MKVLKSMAAALAAIVILAGARPAPAATRTHLSGDASLKSGYASVPKKKGAVSSTEGLESVREDAVRPEEVYKHGVQEISVIATDTGFHPSRIYVRRNIPVHLFLTSASPSKLCFVMDDFQIRKGVMIQQVDQVNFLPTKVGEYRFYCPVGEISGSVVVRD
jgi:hypothetical protein